MRRKGSDERKMVEHLMDSAGAFDWNPALFAAAYIYEHPTLQQKTFSSILAVIDSLADEYIGGRCDVRNAEAGRLAHIMRCALIDDAEANGKVFNPVLPYIGK